MLTERPKKFKISLVRDSPIIRGNSLLAYIKTSHRSIKLSCKITGRKWRDCKLYILHVTYNINEHVQVVLELVDFMIFLHEVDLII